MTTVSAIILTKNRRALLEEALRSLFHQRVRPAQVVIVDNQSEDDTREMLAQVEAPFELTVIDGPKGGWAEARNAGIAAATGDWVLFLDDDCEADRFAIERMLEEAEHDDLVAVGGVVLPSEELDAPDGFSPEVNWSVGLISEGIFGKYAGRRYLPSTSCMMARRSLFEDFPMQEVGGRAGDRGGDYDAGREDAEWWSQLRRAGQRVAVAKRAIAWHHVTQDRMEWPYIRGRAASDGRAFWNRRRCHEEVAAAIEDVCFQPAQLLRLLSTTDIPAGELWQAARLWSTRQAAMIEQAVDDNDHGVSPVTRTAGYLRHGLRLALSGAKTGARFATRRLYKDFVATKELPTVAEEPPRLLVICHDLLGDGVLSLPALRAFAEAFSSTEIDLLTGPVCAPVFEGNLPENVEIMETTAAERSSYRGLKHLFDRLNEVDYDGALLMYCHRLNPLPLFALPGVPVVSFTEDNGMDQKLWGDLVSHPVKKPFWKAEAAALMDLLAPFGVKPKLAHPSLKTSEEAQDRVGGIFKKAGVGEGEAVVVQFEHDDRSKFWPQDRLAELVRRIAGAGVPVFLDGSRKGRLAAEKEGLLDLDGCFCLNNLLTTGELAELSRRSRLFIGADSGPAHVARAVGTPQILLWGVLELHRWGPMKWPRVENPVDCDVLFGAPGDWLVEEIRGLPHNEALRLLGLEEVWGMVSKRLKI